MSAAKTSFARVLATCFLLIVFAQLCYSQDVPQIFKVDPPRWWVRHSINPVRLLIHGRNLSGARVQSLDPGVKFGVPKVNSRGTYVFVDAFIAPNTRSGTRRFRLAAANGATNATFEV